MQTSSRQNLLSIASFILLSLFALLLLIGTAILAVLGLLTGTQGNLDLSTSTLLMSVGAGFSALVLLPACFYNLRQFMDKKGPRPDHSFRVKLTWPTLVVLLTIWGIGILAGDWLVKNTQTSWLTLPLFMPLAWFPPVILLALLAINRLDLGSRWRAWSIFGLANAYGALLAIILEVVALGFLLVLVMVFLSTQPGLMADLEQLISRMQYAPDSEETLRSMVPYLFNPATIGLGLASLSLIIPLIEETVKPLGVWLFAGKIENPRIGFAMGALSGAGFALFENFTSIAGGASDWGVQVVARGGAAVMHVTASGLVGWGIVSAWRERRWLRLLGSFALAVTIHGLWNASAIGLALGEMGQLVGPDVFPPLVKPIALVILGLLVACGVGFLFLFNHRLQSQQPDLETAEPQA